MGLTYRYFARKEDLVLALYRRLAEEQPSYVDLVFLAAGSPEACRRFPQLDHTAALDELSVVSDDGGVYTGASAWVMCLWALQGYRAWTARLSTPELLPFARQVVLWVARNRFRFGSRTLEQALTGRLVASPDCADGACVRGETLF